MTRNSTSLACLLVLGIGIQAGAPPPFRSQPLSGWPRGSDHRETAHVEPAGHQPPLTARALFLLPLGSPQPDGYTTPTNPCTLYPPLGATARPGHRHAATAAPIHDKDETVYITRTGKKYHRAGCRSLAKSRIPIALAEAAARYGPCGICKPPTASGGAAPAKPERAPASGSSSVGQGVSRQCTGITKKGARCKRTTRSPNGRCYQHGGD